MSNIFTVTEEHLKLLQNMYVSWFDCEYGAPSIDPKRPYGNSSVEHDIIEILGWEVSEAVKNGEDDIPNELYSRCANIHREMKTVLQILVSNLSIVSGKYLLTSKYDSTSWRYMNEEFQVAD